MEPGKDIRTENLLTADDVSLIIPDEYGERSFRDVVLAKRDGSGFNRIPASHPGYMPLAYPLMFPSGKSGFRWNLQLHQRRGRTMTRVTPRAYYRFYLFPRSS